MRSTFLPPLDVTSADPIDPFVRSTIMSRPVVIDGETFAPVTLTVPARTATSEATGELYEGLVHISRIPDPALGPRPLPADLDLSIYTAMQPFGVQYNPPVPISFPNVEHFPPGKMLDIFGLNHDTGIFHPDCNFDKFIFFDELHPTKRIHERVGRGLFAVIPEFVDVAP
jgi:hypothetical protein